jgi:hypothetical protein
LIQLQDLLINMLVWQKSEDARLQSYSRGSVFN